MRRSLGPLTIAFAALLGCAPSGEDPYSRTERAGPDSRVYSIHYLAPPWEVVDVEGETTQLRIVSNAEAFGGVETSVDKYELLATVERGTPSDLLATELRMATRAGEAILVEGELVETRQGISGPQTITRTPGAMSRYRRIVFLPLPDGRTLRLAFDATPNLDTLEVDAMIELVTIGGAS